MSLYHNKQHNKQPCINSLAVCCCKWKQLLLQISLFTIILLSRQPLRAVTAPAVDCSCALNTYYQADTSTATWCLANRYKGPAMQQHPGVNSQAQGWGVHQYPASHQIHASLMTSTCRHTLALTLLPVSEWTAGDAVSPLRPLPEGSRRRPQQAATPCTRRCQRPSAAATALPAVAAHQHRHCHCCCCCLRSCPRLHQRLQQLRIHDSVPHVAGE
jgi:hypothetical protein